MSNADPITQDGEFYPDNMDPMMAAIRQGLVDRDVTDSTSPYYEFGDKQVVVIAPEATNQEITDQINMAFGMKKGLCLLLIMGGGKNPDADAPGPRMTIVLEAQLFVDTRIRGKHARKPLELLGAVMRHFHHQEIRISGFAWYEQIRVLGFDPLPDDEATAYAINMERDFQL